MEKLIQISDSVQIRVNPAGLVTMQSGEKRRSLALVQFARSVFANPALVVVEPTESEEQFLIVTADGNRWWFDSQALTIVKDESEDVEFVQVSEMAASAQTSAQATEEVSAQVPDQVQKPAIQPKEQTVSEKPTRKAPKWMVALSEILRVQGFSEEQISSILSQVSQSTSRPQRPTFDTSTREGAFLAEWSKLYRKFVRLGLKHSKLTADDMEIEFIGGKKPALVFRLDGKEFRYSE